MIHNRKWVNHVDFMLALTHRHGNVLYLLKSQYIFKVAKKIRQHMTLGKEM